MKKLLLSGLAAIVLATSVAACDTEEMRAGGEYNRVVSAPAECVKIVGGGYSGSYSDRNQTSYDVITCLDKDGNLLINRLYKMDTNQWYTTKVIVNKQ